MISSASLLAFEYSWLEDPKFLSKVRKRLAKQVASLSLSPGRDDFIRYIQAKLNEGTDTSAMDSSLEEDILKKISEDISKI